MVWLQFHVGKVQNALLVIDRMICFMVYARALEIANDIANKPDGAVRIAKKAFIMADEQSLLRKKREDKMVYDLWAVKGMK